MDFKDNYRLGDEKNNIPNYYFVSILNSDFIFDYYREFINCTVNIQINDIRQVPVVIPAKQDLEKLEPPFKKAVDLCVASSKVECTAKNF